MIIDCDTGRDDAIAIWLAYTLGIKIDAAVVSYGNTVRGNVSENTLRTLAFVKLDRTPVLIGANEPSKQHKAYTNIVLPRQETSGNGFCNLELPETENKTSQPLSPEELVEHIVTLSKENGPLNYVITGPATNFAAICDVLGTQIHNVIARVTMMGGKMDNLWNEMPGADFNLACDPYAIQTILESGIPMRFVSMNTTWPIALSLGDVEKLKPTNAVSSFSKDIMIAHCKHFAPEPIFRFHDPSVIMTLDDSDGFKETKLSINLDESDPCFGQLTETDNGHTAYIYTGSISLNDMLDALGFET